MLITLLIAAVLVFGLIIVDLARRLEKGKRGELFLQTSVEEAWSNFHRVNGEKKELEVILGITLFERDLFGLEILKAQQQRADAWAMMGQLLEEDLKDRRVPENIRVEVGRNGVHYTFNYDPGILVMPKLNELLGVE